MGRRNVQQQGEDSPLIVRATPIDASEAGAGGAGEAPVAAMSHQAMEADVVLDGGAANAAVPVREAAAAAAAEAKKVLTPEAEAALKKASSVPADVEAGKKEAAAEGPSLFMVLAVVIGFILADAGKPLIEKMSLQSEGTIASAILLNVISALNMVIAAGLAVYCLGFGAAVQQLTDLPTLKQYFVPSFFFAAGQLFTVAQNAFLTPSLRKVFQQLRIPITAMMGRVIMGHGYSTMQWLLIFGVTLALPGFQMSQTATGALEMSDTDVLTGLLFSIITSILACAGSIFAEMYTKAGGKTPFYIQKFQIEVWTFLFGCFGFLVLSPLSGLFADFVSHAMKPATRAKGYSELKKNLPLNYKALHSTVDAMHAALPWETAPAGVPSANKFDTARWESSHKVPSPDFGLPKKMTEGLTGTDLAEMEALLQRFASIKKARATAEFAKDDEGKVHTEMFTARSQLDSVKQITEKVDDKASLTDDMAKQQKFFFKHGFGMKKSVMEAQALYDNFVFTFGETTDKVFKSLAAYQRASPRTVHSDVLKAAGEGESRFYHSAPDFAGDAAYFTGEQNVAEAEVMGNKVSKQTKVTTKLFRKLAYAPAKKTMHVTYEAKQSWETADKQTCSATYGKTVTLQCDAGLEYSADSADFNAKPTDCALAGEAVFHGVARSCKPNKVQTAAEKKAAKEAKDLRKQNWDYDAPAPQLAPVAQQAVAGKVEGKFVSGEQVQATFDKIMATEAFQLKQVSSKDFAKVKAWSYPGNVGAGLPGMCDHALCTLTADQWSKNFGYMANNFKNNPSLKLDLEDKENPFKASEIHGYTRNPMPIENLNFLVILGVVCTIVQGWLSGILSKVLSSLWKNLCQAAALALVVVVQKLFMNDFAKDAELPAVAGGAKWPETLGMTMLVLLSVFAFGQAPKEKKH